MPGEGGGVVLLISFVGGMVLLISSVAGMDLFWGNQLQKISHMKYHASLCFSFRGATQ